MRGKGTYPPPKNSATKGFCISAEKPLNFSIKKLSIMRNLFVEKAREMPY